MTPAADPQETYSEILAKAAQDSAFRREFLTNPKATVEEAFGINLPVDHEIKVLVSDAKTTYVAIPYVPTHEDALSDSELEAVAGGKREPSAASQKCYLFASIIGLGVACAGVPAIMALKHDGDVSCYESGA